MTIVTTGSPQGDKYAMTASSFMSVSLEPPTVLVCINKRASISAPLLASRHLCINVLGARHRKLAVQCAGAIPATVLQKQIGTLTKQDCLI